jgi:pyrimidine operon attenuation protein/uracil phosphoribosyltransferase
MKDKKHTARPARDASAAGTKDSPARTPIMEGDAIQRALRRIAHEIIEQNADLKSVVLAGIPLRGVEIARRLSEFIRDVAKIEIETGTIDVAMHRDDVGTRAELPMVHASNLPLPLEGRTVIIVDDVLFTGRTARAALDAISSFGRPARIQLAALVDRGHRELPIRADYVGKNLPTATREQIQVRLQQIDNQPDAVWLFKE